jgi:hypothetical protein
MPISDTTATDLNITTPKKSILSFGTWMIRGAIIQQAKDWVRYGETEKADSALKEVKRLDLIFGVNAS